MGTPATTATTADYERMEQYVKATVKHDTIDPEYILDGEIVEVNTGGYVEVYAIEKVCV